jgi:Flp pilus assembly protein CpaB
MKRGGIILLLLVFLILILSAAAYYFLLGPGAPGNDEVEEPVAELSTIVIMAQPVARDALIVEAALTEIPYPVDQITASMFRSKLEVADVYYAKYPLVQGQPLTRELISERPGILQEGSDVARTIPAGKTAITIPMSRLGAVGFGIRDGDRVNVIVTTSFVDLDTSFQSLLPNNAASITGTGFAEQLPVLTMDIGGGVQGRAELEPTLNQAIYLLPSEPQRPRLVSQMILQDIQVLHVGEFNLAGQAAAAQPAVEDPAAAEAEAEDAPPPVPDIITLIVSPQEAVTLTYLLFSQANVTLTLRSPDDPNFLDTESVTLQYLISQYNIALPAKLPYGMNPRLDQVEEEPVVP